ncbi:MAG: hypothetical protein GX419_00130 [Bacteroidales bacterium]|jgi:hypothetical protein|nr:hypothetical protein [Bacteroidales bacterium]
MNGKNKTGLPPWREICIPVWLIPRQPERTAETHGHFLYTFQEEKSVLIALMMTKR